VVARCSDTIAFRPLGEAQVKGRATALELYEVVGEKAQSGWLPDCPEPQEARQI